MSTPPNEVRQWDEAVLWFLARVPMTKAEWNKLSARARRRAFTVAGVAQADVLHDVFKGIDRAVAKGTGLEEFRKSVGQKLRSAWQGSVKNPAWRLETIYRTNVQHAYSAGRWAQMTDPVVTKHRPFGMFDAILDNRVTERCEELDGTILPWEEWQKRGLVPPLHFNCRSGLRSLRKSQAEKKPGWGKTPPEVASQDGFGLPPQSAEWQPDLEKYPPELRNHVQSRLAGADALEPMQAPEGARFSDGGAGDGDPGDPPGRPPSGGDDDEELKKLARDRLGAASDERIERDTARGEAHVPGSRSVKRDLRRGRGVHVFNEDADLRLLERKVWTEGVKLDVDRGGWVRFALRMATAIGVRLQTGKPDVLLRVLEIKAIFENGRWMYHLVPRTKFAENSKKKP